MGGGAWTSSSATAYVTTAYASRGTTSLDDFAKLSTDQIYSARHIDPLLDPKGVIRECRDSAEHPNTIPIILALDVTGSMGLATKHCATKLNDIMETLYSNVKDVEFMMMGIGDLAYDSAPIQVTQFESDVRILDQTTKIWFEQGGGGNSYESYTAAWYFGLNRTELDCWKRGKKGIIITLGDEPLNPYLPGKKLGYVLNGQGQEDIDTKELYQKVIEKFDVYHIAVTDKESCFDRYEDRIKESWGRLLGQRCLYAKSENLPEVISQIVNDSMGNCMPVTNTSTEGISW